jgi:hypothetical protein
MCWNPDSPKNSNSVFACAYHKVFLPPEFSVRRGHGPDDDSFERTKQLTTSSQFVVHAFPHIFNTRQDEAPIDYIVAAVSILDAVQRKQVGASKSKITGNCEC